MSKFWQAIGIIGSEIYNTESYEVYVEHVLNSLSNTYFKLRYVFQTNITGIVGYASI